jgi:hypothetical protein
MRRYCIESDFRHISFDWRYPGIDRIKIANKGLVGGVDYRGYSCDIGCTTLAKQLGGNRLFPHDTDPVKFKGGMYRTRGTDVEQIVRKKVSRAACPLA